MDTVSHAPPFEARTFVVATAGHVDHGKTTLVRALTGVDTDRLEEEKRRGITIELGFAPLALPDGARASIVDVPGHRRFVPTMIAGASGIDLVLLVVAADEGVMPQTREHANVCALLGIRRALIALTKIDRVDEELSEIAAGEIRALAEGRFEYAIVPSAACAPAHIEAIRTAIAAALRGVASRRDGRAHLWIDRVLSIRGAGTVVRGTLVRGRLAAGQTVTVTGAKGRRSARVRGLHVHGTSVTEVFAPTRVAVSVAIDADEVASGDLVTSESAAPEGTTCVDVAARGAIFRRGARVVLHVGTASSAARITRVDTLGGAGTSEHLARVVMDAPLPIAAGEQILLRGSHVTRDEGATLAGGTVLDARPLRMRPRARLDLARALRDADARNALDTLVDAVAPRPLDLASVAVSVPLANDAARAVEKGQLVACGSGVIRRRTVAELASRARSRVTEHLARAPLDRGMPLASLRAELARASSEAAADLALLAARAPRGADDGGMIAIEGDVAVPAARSRALPADVEAYLARVRSMIAATGVHGLSSGYVCDSLGVPAARARAVLAALEREAMAVRAGDLWFSRSVVEDVRERVVSQLASGRAIRVADAKALCGLPRRQAILLLEHFDAAGITRRIGEARVLASAVTNASVQEKAP